MAMRATHPCTVTVGGCSFQTTTQKKYVRNQPILKVGMVYLTKHATVQVLQPNLYAVTLQGGEYATVYRAPNGKLIGFTWFVSAVIDAIEQEWQAILAGARG